MESNTRRKVMPIVIPPTCFYPPQPPQEFTPPITPYSLTSSSGTPQDLTTLLDAIPPPLPPPSTDVPTDPLIIQQRQFLLGEGAWSRVYAIRSHNIAVKTPSAPGGREVIEKEAKILHYLTTVLPDLKIARFRGFDVLSSSLFMELVSMGTLESFVERRARELAMEKEEGRNALANMRRPVVGMGQWLFLAERLAGVFSRLKEVGVVHGDVKWSNILLREFRPANGNPEDTAWAACRTKLYEPVVVDFSSGHFHLRARIYSSNWINDIRLFNQTSPNRGTGAVHSQRVRMLE
ncbi:hypothetical protein C7212DRAFT_363691 [Tuber magnatum]|uniref:Protein kinase domain-containing protein n=1 Tax=Tuber magnatum TaxID=42249 RepID=A0A317SUB4_9PEZI|nr:hypothetical protein C7212DRAFT_363691 [Tuber magnatum]